MCYRFLNRLGRKITLITAAIPGAIHWILIVYADSVLMLYISKFLVGFSIGMVYLNVMPMYLSEIASDKIRGTIGIIFFVQSKMGFLYVYAVGPVVSFQMLAWISLCPVLTFIILFFWVPESPHYLVGVKNFDGARNSLAKLRGHTDVNDELEKIVEAIQISDKHNASIKDIFNRGNIKSFNIALALSLGGIACGCSYLLAYSQIIFGEIENSLLSPSESNIIFGIILILSAIVATIIIDRFGRRPLLLVSAGTLVVSNAAVAIYFEMMQQGIDTINLAWLPTTMLMVFIFGYGIGMATVTFIVISEIFPKQIKGGAAAVVAIITAGFSIGYLKLCQFISDTYGYSYTFWMFFVFSFLLLPFIWFVVPETKGKSLALILEELNAGNKKR